MEFRFDKFKEALEMEGGGSCTMTICYTAERYSWKFFEMVNFMLSVLYHN
jgi:hypothetical protein